MKIRTRLNLIPRNNWDYGLKGLFGSFTGLANGAKAAPNVRKAFQQEPIFTNSGRTSLYAILKALELPAGAQVGVPLFCCSVVFDAISQAGLSPRFIDSNLDDCNISTDDLSQKMADLASIVIVHMFGNPCEVGTILALAGEIPVIEDCAQSLFSTYQGRPTGSLTTASFYSFRVGKYLSVGEGSAIFCKDVELHRKIEQLVDTFASWSIPGMLVDSCLTYAKATLYNRPWYGLVGHPIGMRLDKKLNLTAKEGFETGKIASTHLALVESRISSFQQKIDLQREHAQMLLKALAPGDFAVSSESNGNHSNWFQLALRFSSAHQRDIMAEYLFSQGIDSSKYLDDIVDVARANYGYQGDCPNAEKLSKTILLIPIYYTLTNRDIEHIALSINAGSKLI